MKYIDGNNKLIVTQEFANQEKTAYWIVLDFCSDKHLEETGHLTSMKMHLYVNRGDIINKCITLKEGLNELRLSSHNHDNDGYKYDIPYTSVEFNDYYLVNKKKDEREAKENKRLTTKEEASAVSNMLIDNEINVDATSIIHLLQKSLVEYKNMTRDDNGLFKDALIFGDFESTIENIFKYIRVDKFKQNFLKQQGRLKKD